MRSKGMWQVDLRGAALSVAGLLLTTAVTVSGFFNSTVAIVLGVGSIVPLLVVLLLSTTPLGPWYGSRDAVTKLDQEMEYVVRVRHAVESNALVDPPEVMGEFSAPNGDGRYGEMDLAAARSAFQRLQALGVIRRVSFDAATRTTIYDWTPVGRSVLSRLASASSAPHI